MSCMNTLKIIGVMKMSKVYVLTLHYPHEGSEVFGVYTSEEAAEAEGVKVMKLDKSNGYNEVEIDEVELDEVGSDEE